MNRKRPISIVLLAALLLAQALPARAGAMLCPMKAEARGAQVSCKGCDETTPSAEHGLLRSRGCCHMTQGAAADATPVVLSTRRLAPAPQDLLAAPVPLLASATPDGFVRAIAWSAAPGVTLLASTTRTTILRN
ncbi:MAG TPA: hypothetical protein VFP58_00960 [Candidatus Eisenbacteria bacterium]|nr:hypothetical protein [Candidatus Eisenbacteria bacterium]